MKHDTTEFDNACKMIGRFDRPRNGAVSLSQAIEELEKSRAAERHRADCLWQQCENYRIALQELYKYQLPTGALNLIQQVLETNNETL